MKQICLAFIALLLPTIAAHAAEPYRLNPGDVLHIALWKEEGLQSEVLILPDGNITFPLAGHIRAAGRSAKELQDILFQRMKKFFADPVITVSVKRVAGNRIYVIGQVKKPGHFQANGPVDVMQALSLAGGLTTFAAEGEVRILRRDNKGQQRAIEFDYAEVSKGNRLRSNVILKSGDVVVVPTSGLF
jgi:polysaccharide export outer membrane protein